MIMRGCPFLEEVRLRCFNPRIIYAANLVPPSSIWSNAARRRVSKAPSVCGDNGKPMVFCLHCRGFLLVTLCH